MAAGAEGKYTIVVVRDDVYILRACPGMPLFPVM